jgi:hypothetical protein
MLTHEMDAIRCSEWRLFLFLANLTDERGFVAFTALHVPLYLGLFVALFGAGTINPTVAAGFDWFCIVHVGLHILFRRNPAYQFNSPFSWAIICAAGIAGGADLLMRLMH